MSSTCNETMAIASSLWAEIENSLKMDLDKIDPIQINRLGAQKEMKIVVSGSWDKLEDLINLRSKQNKEPEKKSSAY